MCFNFEAFSKPATMNMWYEYRFHNVHDFHSEKFIVNCCDTVLFSINSRLLIHKNKMLINQIHSLHSVGSFFSFVRYWKAQQFNRNEYARFCLSNDLLFYTITNITINSTISVGFFFRFCLLSHSADVPLNNLNNSENRFINATRCKQFSTSVAFAHGFIAINYTLPIELSKNKPKRKKNCEEFFVVLYNSAYCEYQHIS